MNTKEALSLHKLFESKYFHFWKSMTQLRDTILNLQDEYLIN